MSCSEEYLLQSNREQAVSETDLFTPERYIQMFRHVPPSAVKLLDVGCNTGRGGAQLKALSKNIKLTGFDCVPERIAKLDRTIYDEAICGFSTKIPLSNDSLDAILGGEFLEHVPPADIDTTLAEFFRVLRLRGRLILTTPNPNYLKNKLKKLSVLLEKSHLTQHYPDCLRQRLRTVGFSNVRVFGSGRVSSYIGQRWPILSLYGSYLIRADKW